MIDLKYLKEIRLEKGISARQLSSIFNAEESAVSQIERGKRNLTVKMLKKYCEYFDVSADKILNLSSRVVKPICRSYKMQGDDGRIIHFYTCPKCGFESLEPELIYCPGCGCLINKEGIYVK